MGHESFPSDAFLKLLFDVIDLYVDLVVSAATLRVHNKDLIMASQWNDKRPMSPHLQIWRWHPAMLSSILHRACAIISYVALIIVAIGLLVLALTGKLPLEGLIFSPLGAIGLAIFVFAFIFMALAQLRHAIWDRGAMMDPDKNNKLTWGMIGLAALFSGIVVGLAL